MTRRIGQIDGALRQLPDAALWQSPDAILWQSPDAILWQLSDVMLWQYSASALIGPSLLAAVTARTTAATIGVGAVSDCLLRT
jgi:hypothetical protein